MQRAVRSGCYYYLETGSYLGGSIQQHLPDPLCRGIVSIDKRPLVSPDDRNERIEYPDNATALMLQYLRRVDQGLVSKIKTFDADAKDLDPAAIANAPKFCFIDGEHTRAAAISDDLSPAISSKNG